MTAAGRRRELDGSGYVVVERRRSLRASTGFDRVGYALRTLAILKPRGRVAVYEGGVSLRVERGVLWDEHPDRSWALVSIPRDATRAQIAVTIAELLGMAQVPYVIDALMAAVEG